MGGENILFGWVRQKVYWGMRHFMGDMCRRFRLTCRFYHKGRENVVIYIYAPDYTEPHKWRQLSSLRCLTRKKKQNIWTRYNNDHTKWTTLKKRNWKVCLKKMFALFTEGIMQIRWDIKMGVADPQTQRPTGNKETVQSLKGQFWCRY